MSTASTSRAALNSDEFPVLLRLPDLNAPVWTPTSAATIALDLSPPPMTTTFRLDGGTAAAAGPATAESPVAPTTVASAEPISLPADRAQRSSRGEMPNFTQWPLVKQLATGGVLVGGLALTYLMVMGGSPPTPPDQATIQPSEAPPLVVDSHHAHNVTPKPIDAHSVASEEGKSPVNRGIAPVPPPPEFDSNWNIPTPSPAPPEGRLASKVNSAGAFQNIEVVTDKPVVDDSGAAAPELSPPVVVPPADSRNEAARYEGRIGPSGSSSAIHGASSYPTTDPSTFMYRPGMETPPDAGRPGMARLDGTINPPPRR